jgi:MFS family permease
VASSTLRLWPRGGLWRHSDFIKLWAGQSISEFGSQVSQIAIPTVAILTLKATTFEVAALGTVEFAPFVLFTLPAGVWVDRLSRRSILIVGDIGRAALLVSIPIAYAFDVLTLGQLYVVGFLVGILTVFFDVAYQSYLPALVERDALVEGNSKLSMTQSGAAIAGPGLAGGLIALATAPFALLVDAASFVVSGAFTLAIRKREPTARGGTEERKLLAELWEGLRYVLRHRYLLPQALATGSSNFCTSAIFALYFVYAYRNLGLTPALVGLAGAIGAVGWLLGASQADRLRRVLGVGRMTTLGAALTCPAALLIPLAPHTHWAAVAFLAASGALMGFGMVIYNIPQVSLRQAITPERLQGRMNATMRFLVWGTMPLGSLAGGGLAAAIGLRPALFAAAIASFVSVLPIVLSPIRSLRDIPEPEPDVPMRHEPGLLPVTGGPAPTDA